MEGSDPPSPNIFEAGTEYKRLHTIALLLKPEVNLENEFAVAVLQHTQNSTDCSSGDFLWFKVKSKHSVSKIKRAYRKRTNVEVDFKLANNPIGDAVQMKDLNLLKDNIVVFTAHEAGHASPPSVSRAPLQRLNTQVSANLTASNVAKDSILAKAEQSYTSPYAVSPSVPVKDENGDMFPRSQGRSQTRDTPTRLGRNLTAPSGAPSPKIPATSMVKSETHNSEETSMSGIAEASATLVSPNKPSHNERVQHLNENGSPEELEAEVKNSQKFLETLKAQLASMLSVNEAAQYFAQQINDLLSQKVDTPTIIGVVGNTGAGKSSVINAMLEEERLVPTNCMRACTAVVTEMSWNSSEDENEKYRAHIEFIGAADWERDLRISLTELIDGNGQVSRECTNAESEAGIAYAKIKAVYPQKTKEELASSTVEQLMNEPGIKEVLGTVKKVAKGSPEAFYRALQHYVDSKEKATADSKKKIVNGEKKQTEWWPLIRVVRIFTKAEALSTGAVIVDLPGVHDSNAARAAVAAGYMKQCTGLFIVAPINRAVDDKAAKSLLGESFKRQLKFDGTYPRITFICSKTDDISIIEASDSLGLEEEMAADWEKIDELEKEQRTLKQSVKDLKESKAVYTELINDAEDGMEVWEKLKSELEDGNEVFAPSGAARKRKRSAEPSKSRKKSKRSRVNSDDEDDFIDDDDEEEEDANDWDVESNSDIESETGDPLTMDLIEGKLAQLKDDKKRARQEKIEIDNKIKKLNQELKVSEKAQGEIETAMSALCIGGRNKYSKSAIQRDFADGIRELDMESAQEEDPEKFNPDEELRDYSEVARSLPVFCVSSRAYQKLRGRLQRDNKVPGFRSTAETEIPQLQAHCKKLTEAGRASNCRNFLTRLSQLLNSLRLWAANDGTGLNLTDTQLAAETRFLNLRLKTLEKSLYAAVKDCLKEMNEALAEHIFEKYEQLIEGAISEANATASRWHSPINRENRHLGGYFWATYKAIVRRDGVFSNAQGLQDLNFQLIEPIIKNLGSHWERVFAQRMPRVLQSFTRAAKSLLNAFHREIESRSMKSGAGSAGIALLGQQLRNYENIFRQVSQQMIELINNLQREANREFTPIIARNLSTAYDWCANESGPGQFKRMQSHMASHVDTARSEMFQESCDEVRNRLLDMCKQVEEGMSLQTDEIFMRMQRDYTEVVSGTRLPQGQMMPRQERKMRSDVTQTIEDFEKESAEAQLAAEAAKLAVEEEQKNLADSAEEESLNLITRSPATTGRPMSEDRL